MKKKLLGTIVVLAMSCAMMGCGGSGEKQISGDVQNNEQGTNSEETNSNAGAESKDDAAKSGYVFTVNGTDITIGAEAAGVLEKLGEPLSKYESPSCAFGDLDVSYTYGGFELDTYQQGGVDYVSAVILQDDSVATPEGLYIGDDASKVEEIYGAATSQSAGNNIYKSGDMKLSILVKNGSVASIQYLNTMLE